MKILAISLVIMTLAISAMAIPHPYAYDDWYNKCAFYHGGWANICNYSWHQQFHTPLDASQS